MSHTPDSPKKIKPQEHVVMRLPSDQHPSGLLPEVDILASLTSMAGQVERQSKAFRDLADSVDDLRRFVAWFCIVTTAITAATITAVFCMSTL